MKRASWTACALTLGNLLCGFAAIVLGVRGYAHLDYFHLVPVEVVQGAWFLLLGMFLDGLDGRVARMTKADSAFGAELDSLADVVSFGLAPAVLTWVVGMRAEQPESVLWAAGSLYAASAALRLARYNVQHALPRRAHEKKPADFEGLPSPAAAGLVAGLLLLAGEAEEPQVQKHLLLLLPAFAVAGGLLMVSRVPYLHVMNRLGRRGLAPVKGVAALGLLAALASYPALTLAIAFTGYALAGLAWGALSQILPRPEPEEDWADERSPRR